jgi:hypothetical protein
MPKHNLSMQTYRGVHHSLHFSSTNKMQRKKGKRKILAFFLMVVLGVHCGIYKSSCNMSNISYLNSLLSSFSFSFIPPCHIPAYNSFNRSHFSSYIHVYTVFVPYSTSHTLSSHPPPSHWYQLIRQDLFCPPIL